MTSWKDFKESHILLNEQLKQKKIFKDDSTLFPVSFSPHVISESRYNKLAYLSVKVLTAIKKLIKNYPNNDYIQKFFPEFNLIKNLIVITPDYEEWIQIGRFDFAEDEQGNFKLMETNCAQPGGAALIPIIKSIYEKLPFFKDFTKDKLILPQLMDNEDFFLKSIFDTYQDLTKQDVTHIGFAYSDFYPLTTDMDQLVAQSKELGIMATMFKANELEIKNKKAYIGGCPLDIIHHKFDFITDSLGNCRPCFYKKSENEVVNYLEALKNKICINLNSLISMTIADSKKIIPLLLDQNIQHLFDKTEIDAINELCPDSHVLSKELLKNNDFLINKDHWVLKAANSTRSRDVYIGKEIHSDEWKKLIIQHLDKPSIIQEFIKNKSEKIINERATNEEIYKSNLALYLIKGKASGLLCRATKGYKSNFYAGGIYRPSYIIQ